MSQIESTWEQVCDLVASALELPVEQRSAFLDAARVGAQVKAEAASLVASAADGAGAKLLDHGLQVFVPDLADLSRQSLWTGRRLGTYQVMGELGEGGMGLVLLGKRADDLYERTVAIKVIRSSLAGNDFTRRFRRETRILARLQHSAITSLLDAGTTEENLPYLVMEYVDGVPIHLYTEREKLTLPQLLQLVVTLCDALAHAHAKGVVHRDVKPNNILVNSTGELKLLDFGIAGLLDGAAENTERTLTCFRAVTPAYASPEQIRGGEVTFKTDIYSVGVLLYVLLTGSLPFQFDRLSAAEIERILLTGQTTLPSQIALSRFDRKEVTALDAVIGRAMNPEPARRYATIEELKADLLRVIAHQKPTVSGRRYLLARWWRQRRSAAKFGGIIAAGVLAAAAAGLWLRHEHRPVVAAPSSRIAVAVVPLASVTGSAWQTIAAQEALGTELASGNQIRVVSAANIAQAMRDLHLTSAQALTSQQRVHLGQLLRVAYLLEERANKDRDADQMHIEVTLDRAATGQLLSRQATDSSAADLEHATQRLAVEIARLLPLKHVLTASPSLLPHSPAAVSAYSEGLEHLQALEPIPARAALEQAAAIEPRSSLVHAALARTWDMLGYRPQAVEEAEQAMALDAGLPMRTKLVVEAQANEIRHQWPTAIAAYTTLRDFDPDEVDHILGLARCQLAANQGDAALKVLRTAEQMPSLLGADPRIELLISIVEETLGRHADALRDANKTLTAGRERGAMQLMAQAQSARASALESLGKIDQGMAAAQQAQTLFASAGDVSGQAINFIATGNFLEDQARYAEAKTLYLQAKEIFRKTGDEAHQAVAENDLGIVADDIGDPQEALAHYTGALGTFRRVGNQQRVPLELNNIGLIQKELSQVDAARRSYMQALHLLEQLHDNKRVAQEYNNLGFLSIGQGNLDEAEQEFRKAFEIYSGTGQIAGTIYATDGLAHVAWNRGRLEEAHARYQEAIRIARKIPELKQVAIALRADAHVLHDAGNEDNARRELKESQDLRDAHHEVVAGAEVKLSGIIFDLDGGQSIRPESRFTDLLDVFVSKKADVDAADVQLAWTSSLLLEDRISDAVQHLQIAKAMMQRLRDDDLKKEYLVATARIAAKQRYIRAAQRILQTCVEEAKKRGDVPTRMNLSLELAKMLAMQHDQHSETLLRQYAAEAKSRSFLRVAGQIEALERPHKGSAIKRFDLNSESISGVAVQPSS